MPIEITEAEDREYRRYKELGTPSDLAEKVKKVGDLENDNKTLRDERRDLRGKVPKDGAVVLEGDDVKRWEAFQALQKTPEELAAGAVLTPDERKEWEAFKALELKAADVPNIVKERDELKSKDAQRTRQDTITAVVRAMKWPDETAATIADMRSLDGAKFEVKKEKVKDGTGAEVETDVPYVTVKDGQPAKFSDFAAQTEALKGIRTSAEDGKTDDKTYISQVTGGGKSGGYDPAKEGREMAEKQKASKGTENLAFT